MTTYKTSALVRLAEGMILADPGDGSALLLKKGTELKVDEVEADSLTVHFANHGDDGMQFAIPIDIVTLTENEVTLK